ncbi:MAG: hypothetical protein HY744_01900 [Deltaproteobacteria bacterium]|nr:hypothetical protein [Deltaproteobacteria bacterium]
MQYRECHITGLTILWAALLAAPAAHAQGGLPAGRQAPRPMCCSSRSAKP